MNYETPLFFRVMEYADAAERDVIDMVSRNPDWEPPRRSGTGFESTPTSSQTGFSTRPARGYWSCARRSQHAAASMPIRSSSPTARGEANYLAMARALERERGSEILLTDPVYPYYPGKTTMLGGTQRFVATDEEGQLDPDNVRAAASEETAAIVVNTPNNPTGAVYPAETMRELVAIAETYDAVLISDEVYDHYDLSGAFASALETDIGPPDRHQRVFEVDGDHRSQVGYAIFPPELVANAKSRHMLVNVATTRPGQFAVLQALRETEPAYYERNRERLRESASRRSPTRSRLRARRTPRRGDRST